MATHAFATLFEPQSYQSSTITGPAKVLHRDYIAPLAPTEHELDGLQWGKKLNGPTSDSDYTSHPPTPGELEESAPPTPRRDQTVEAISQSATNPAHNKWRLASAAIVYTMMGLSDAATGALIPYMERDYNIGYAIVSLVFVTNAVGFLLAAPVVQIIDRRLGRSRSYVLVTSMTTIGYALLVASPVFPVVVVAFLFLGFGIGVFLAMTNLFVVNLLNGTVILGVMHAAYGLGGVVSPIVATAMVTAGARWSYFYAIPLVMSALSLFAMGWSFRGFENDSSVQLLTALERTASRQAAPLQEPTHVQLLGRALKKRTTLLGALFILFYQGAEVAISGWIISFLINYRQGNPARVGNVTAGFWGGITVGRLVLTPLTRKIGERVFVTILVLVAAAMQLVVWLVPNIIGVAVAEAMVGLALGPVYPCATAILSKLLPKNIQITALSFVTSAGSSGGALIPLLTGLLAQRLGTVVLHPIVLISCVIMIVSWLLLPRISKREE